MTTSAHAPQVRLEVSLPVIGPVTWATVVDGLAAGAVAGVESWYAGTYRRTVRLPGGPAVIAATPYADRVDLVAHLSAESDGDAATALVRRHRHRHRSDGD